MAQRPPRSDGSPEGFRLNDKQIYLVLKIIIMRKPRQILDQRLKAFFIIFDEKIPDKSLPFIVGAMKQYAEEYHQSELLKLNKSDVISSVCICKCGKEASCPVCKDCFIKGLEREQTDL